MNATELWRKLRTRSQSNLYFALALLPRRQREAFRDVYRFLRTGDDLVDEAASPVAARAGFETFRAELAAIYDGRASNPDAIRLAGVVQRLALPRRHFEQIVTALEGDLNAREQQLARPTPRFQSFAELSGYCEAVAASLGYLSLAVFFDGAAEAENPYARAYARDLGIALQLANILRDVGEDARRGRIYLPADELREFGVTSAELAAGQMSARFQHLAALQAARARGLIANARAHLAGADHLRHRLVVAEIWADVYLALLAELERKNFDVFGGHVYLRRRSKLRLALRRWTASLLGRRAGGRTAPSQVA